MLEARGKSIEDQQVLPIQSTKFVSELTTHKVEVITWDESCICREGEAWHGISPCSSLVLGRIREHPLSPAASSSKLMQGPSVVMVLEKSTFKSLGL